MDLGDENAALRERLAATEELLRASETRHRLLTESWAQAVWETDPGGAVVTDSPSWRAYTGQTFDECVGYGWLDAIHPDDRIYAERQWREATAARGIVNAEFRLRAPDGRWHWTNVRAAPVLDAEGNVSRWVGLNIDIDGRKRVERALRKREADLARVQRIGQVGGLDIDVADAMQSWRSPEYLRLHGLPSDHRYETHADWRARVHPEDRARAEATLFEALASDDSSYEGEYRIIRADDGAERWIHARADIERNAEGKAVRMIGAHVDVTDQKRAHEALQKSEERFRALVVAGGNSIYRMSADWRLMYQLDSDTLSPTAEPIEDWVDKYIPSDDLPRVRAAIDEAIRGKSLFELEHRVWVADGGIGWVLSRAVPLLGQDGEIVEWFGAGSVVTARKQAEERLRESEDRYRSLFESMDEAYAVVEVLKDEAGHWSDFRFVDANPAFMLHTTMPYPVGQTATELLGRPNPRWTQLYGQALDTKQPLRTEETEPTLHKVFDLNIFTLDEANNRVAVLFTDVTERKRSEAALRDSERWLQTLMKGVPQLVWRAVDGGHWTWASPQWTEFTGQPEVDSHDWGWLDPVHADDREAAKKAWAGAIDRGEFHADYRLCHAEEGHYRWFQTRATPVRNEDGEIIEWLGTSTDVDDLRRSRERQQVLLAELQHRVRNILAVIRSIISRSDDGERSTEDYVSHLQGRISALARTQVLLTRRAGAGVDLEDLIRDELVAQTAKSTQFSLAGPQVELSPKAAEVLTLAIHELATNATKYGAFTRATGRLAVEWNVETRNDQRWLVLSWTECGVPIVDVVPRRQGFGSELISRRIPYELKGTGSFVLQPGGLQSHMEFPLRAGDSILQTGAAA